MVVYHDCVRGITYYNVWWQLIRKEYSNFETLILPLAVACGTLRHNFVTLFNTMDTFDTLSNNMKMIQETATATTELAHFSLPKSIEHIL